MDLHLQFGYGMMEHCRALVNDWHGGTVILSPRDLTDAQLRRLAAEITAIQGGKVLLDPQFYLPHADHERLCSHEYWPADYASGVFWQGQELSQLLGRLQELNQALAVEKLILPGLLAARIDDDWLAIQSQILEEALATFPREYIISTIALSADALRSDDQMALLADRSEAWTCGGYYIVAEHPNGRYLVDDPAWLANLLDLVAGLRINGSDVILGYCNQQMLIAACAKATAIASGTWMNVRSFPPDKFRTTYEDEVKQRATWYYCPQALSEYKVPFLDIAHRLGLLPLMRAPDDMGSTYAADLFRGPQPSAIGFTEQMAFRHFLQCLRSQVQNAVADTFQGTLDRHERILDGAEQLLTVLANSGVRGQVRDFREILDVNRGALAVFQATRGPTLSRKWSTLAR